MEDMGKILEDILLKIDMLCGKMDVLEIKINNISKSKEMNMLHPKNVQHTDTPEIPDTKAMIEKMRAEIMARMQDTVPNMPPNMTTGNAPNIPGKVRKPSKYVPKGRRDVTKKTSKTGE